MPTLLRRIAFAAFLCLLLPGLAGAATRGEWTVDGLLSRESDTTTDDAGSLTTDTTEKEFNLEFSTSLSTVTELTLGFEWSQTDEEPEGEFATRDTAVTLSGDFTAKYWDFSAEWTEDVAETDDPAEFTEVDNSYSLELNVEPEHEALPALNFKYEDDGDSTTTAAEGAFEYTLHEMIDFTLDVSKEVGEPEDDLEDDTDDRSFDIEIALSQEIKDTWKFEADWAYSREQNLSIDSFDRITEKSDTFTNTVHAMLSWAPLAWIEMSVEEETEWDKDLMAGLPSERTDTLTTEASFQPAILDIFSFELGITDDRERTKNTDSDGETNSQEYNFSVEYTPLEILTLSASYDRSDEEDSPDDPAESRTTSRTDDIELSLEGSLWADRIGFSITQDFSESWDDDVRTGEESSLEIEAELTYEEIPNLEITPKTTFTREKNLFEDTEDEDKEIEVGLAYSIDLKGVVTLEFEHTYTRTQTYPDSEADYVEREDDTTVTVAASDFLRGMSSELSWERSASDQSGDDVEAEIDYTIAFTYDWTIVEVYEFAFEFDYDIKDTSEDTQTYSASFTFPFYKDHFELNVEYEYETQLEGETNDNKRYLIEISGEF